MLWNKVLTLTSSDLARAERRLVAVFRKLDSRRKVAVMAAEADHAHHLLGERAAKVEAELHEYFERHVDEHDVAKPEDAHVYVDQGRELAAAPYRPVHVCRQTRPIRARRPTHVPRQQPLDARYRWLTS